MQSEWRRIGVEVVIHNEPPRTLFGETLKHRSFKGLALFTWVSGIESSPRQTLRSSGQIPTAANNWGGGNYPNFRDATMDADIDAMEKELDPRSVALCGPRCSEFTPNNCRCCLCSLVRKHMSGRCG